MTNVGIRTAILLVLSALWLAASYAADPGSAKFNEEFSEQEKIYRSEGEQRIPGYTINRSLVLYADALNSDFDSTLAKLGPSDRWLDIGAGEGLAILGYYTGMYDVTHPEGRDQRGKKARSVAISIEDRRTPVWQQTAAGLEADQIQYLSGRRMREYSLEELGQFQLITDVIGGFSYTDSLSRFVDKVLGFLVVNGSFYTVLQDVHWEDGTNRPHYEGAPFLTEIENADGSELNVCSWLKRIACAEVTCGSRAHWKPPLASYRIRKICEDVKVPALIPVHYKAGTPPERRFQLPSN